MKKTVILFCVALFAIAANAQQKQTDRKVVTKPVDKNLTIKNVYEGAPVYFSVTLGIGYGHRGNLNIGKRYNTNPGVVSMGNGELSLKKPGLYHLEGFVSAEVYGNNSRRLPQVIATLFAGTQDYVIMNTLLPLQEVGEASNSYKDGEKFSIDIYIPEATTFKITWQYGSADFANQSNIYTKGWMTGYLVRE